MLLKKNSSGLLNPETWSKDAYKAMWVEGQKKKKSITLSQLIKYDI